MRDPLYFSLFVWMFNPCLSEGTLLVEPAVVHAKRAPASKSSAIFEAHARSAFRGVESAYTVARAR